MDISRAQFEKLYAFTATTLTLGHELMGSLTAGQEPEALDPSLNRHVKIAFDQRNSPEKRLPDVRNLFRGALDIARKIAPELVCDVTHGPFLIESMDQLLSSLGSGVESGKRENVRDEASLIEEMERLAMALQVFGLIPTTLNGIEFYQNHIVTALFDEDPVRKAESKAFLIYAGASLCLAEGIIDTAITNNPGRMSLIVMALENWLQVVWQDLDGVTQTKFIESVRKDFCEALLASARGSLTASQPIEPTVGMHGFDEEEEVVVSNLVSSRTADGVLVPTSRINRLGGEFPGKKLLPPVGATPEEIQDKFRSLVRLKEQNYALTPEAELRVNSPETTPVEQRVFMNALKDISECVEIMKSHDVENKNGASLLYDAMDSFIEALESVLKAYGVTLDPSRKAYLDGRRNHYRIECAAYLDDSEAKSEATGDEDDFHVDYQPENPNAVRQSMRGFYADIMNAYRFVPDLVISDRRKRWDDFLSRMSQPLNKKADSKTAGTPNPALPPTDDRADDVLTISPEPEEASVTSK